MSLAGQQIQKVYSEWCVKAAEIILAARVDSSQDAQRKSFSFNLQVPERFNVRGEAIARAEFFQLRTQRSFQVEIYLSNEDADDEGELLERWTFTFLPAPAHPEAQLERQNQSLIRKLTVGLRTLLFFVRLQPAHGICRGQQAPARFHLFRVEAWPPTRQPSMELVSQDFVTLQSTVGTLRLSVSQRKDLKSLSTAGPLKGVAAISSQTEKIELEEGFFDGERRLEKISEEVREEEPAGANESLSLAASVKEDGSEQVPERGPAPHPSSSSSSRSMTPCTPQSTPLQGPKEPSLERQEASETLSNSQGASPYLDDLSTIWMSGALPGRRRGRSLDGSHGTCPGTSRSVSPEAPSRQASTDLMASGRARACSGSFSSAPVGEGEICLFGMSSEEDKVASDEDPLDRNVVASAIMEGGGGGAFATARMDAAKLGFPDFDSDGQPSLSRRNSDSQGASPKAMYSPLIASLNPFLPPQLDMPEPDPHAEEAARESDDIQEASMAQLVEEMGDLVCRLEQRQELQIVAEEVRPEELFRRLDSLRDFAEGLAR